MIALRGKNSKMHDKGNRFIRKWSHLGLKSGPKKGPTKVGVGRRRAAEYYLRIKIKL
jgi:hypothetical protein